MSAAADGAGVGDIAPRLPLLRRILKHPRLKQYNRLVVLVMTVNVGWAFTRHSRELVDIGRRRPGRHRTDGTDESRCRRGVSQPYILNALAWLVTRPPTSWPLRVRWALGKYYHFGGLHVGTAVAGTLWYMPLSFR